MTISLISPLLFSDCTPIILEKEKPLQSTVTLTQIHINLLLHAYPPEVFASSWLFLIKEVMEFVVKMEMVHSRHTTMVSTKVIHDFVTCVQTVFISFRRFELLFVKRCFLILFQLND